MGYSRDTKTISFNEIIPRSSVRVTDDNMIYVIDLIKVIVSERAQRDTFTILRHLPDDFFAGDEKIILRSTGGLGNSKTRLISCSDALEFIMLLPGAMSKEVRMQFADIIKRYLAANEVTVDDIKADTAMELLESRKHKIEIDSMESQARYKSERRKIEIDSRKLRILIQKLEFIKSLLPDGQLDDQVCAMFRNAVVNSLGQHTC
jgi:hypothetical protein